MAKSLPSIALNLGQATISVQVILQLYIICHLTRLFTLQNNPVTSAVKANDTFRYSVKLINSKKKVNIWYSISSAQYYGRPLANFCTLVRNDRVKLHMFSRLTD